MHNATNLRLSECSFQRCAIADVRFDQLVILVGQVFTDVLAFDRRGVEVIEVIHNNSLPIAFTENPIDQMRADESRATSYQNASHALVFCTLYFALCALYFVKAARR